MKEFVKRYWKVIAWSTLIFTASSIPTLPKVGFIWWDFLLKKGGHVFLYAVLFHLTVEAMNHKGNWRTPFLFGLAFALSDEYHQSFVPGRTSLLTDVGFDSLGMLLSCWGMKTA